jgi:hypothetical protein
MAGRRRQRIVAGLTLIVLGLALYALQKFEGIGQATIFFLVGGAFLAAYFARREYGFLIPGCILLGLGAGSIGHDSFFFFGDSTLLGLGCGFVAIFLIALVYQRRTSWWPLIPGSVLLLVGLPDTERVFEILFDNWPLILVVIGLLILIGAVARPRSHGDAGSGD